MKHKISCLPLAALTLAFALPALAQQMSEEALLELATAQGVCPDDQVPVSAVYETATKVKVTCGEATAFAPALLGLGGAGAAAGATIVGMALAAGGGGATGTTSTTSTTN